MSVKEKQKQINKCENETKLNTQIAYSKGSEKKIKLILMTIFTNG